LNGLIEEAAERFKIKTLIWVGDRGMIKSTQIEQIKAEGFHYITAITKAQIETLIKNDSIQLNLFDSELVEVIINDIRYILRRNPVRAQEIAQNRDSKYKNVQELALKLNTYLKEHPKAQPEKALKKLNGKINKLGLSKWLSAQIDERTLTIISNEQEKQEISRLDGCYVIITDVPSEVTSKKVIHSKYKDLALVEEAFRTCKTGYLELRPIFVRKDSRTRGHVFVVMLAYKLAQALKKHWESFNITVEEGIQALCMLSLLEVKVNDKTKEMRLPEPTQISKQLLEALNVKLPKTVSPASKTASTKKTLKRNDKNSR
jgi:transposase